MVGKSAEIARQEEACETWNFEPKEHSFIIEKYKLCFSLVFLFGTPLYSLHSEVPRSVFRSLIKIESRCFKIVYIFKS